MKKYLFLGILLFIFLICCQREYTCECVSKINNIETERITYTATGNNEKDLCDDGDRAYPIHLDSNQISNLAPYNWEKLGLEYPADSVVDFERICTAK